MTPEKIVRECANSLDMYDSDVNFTAIMEDIVQPLQREHEAEVKRLKEEDANLAGVLVDYATEIHDLKEKLRVAEEALDKIKNADTSWEQLTSDSIKITCEAVDTIDVAQQALAKIRGKK